MDDMDKMFCSIIYPCKSIEKETITASLTQKNEHSTQLTEVREENVEMITMIVRENAATHPSLSNAVKHASMANSP